MPKKKRSSVGRFFNQRTSKRSLVRSAIYVAIGTVSVASAMTNVSAADGDNTVMLGEDESLLSGIPGEGLLSVEQATEWLANDSVHQELSIDLPKGIDAAKGNIFIPSDNPMTRAKVELGRQLYFDPRLSSDNSISCASCHNPAEGYGAQTQFGVGVQGQEGGRNSPVSYNRIVSKEQFWDGRAATLEDQAIGPIANPIEMGNTHDSCIADLAANPVYKLQFDKVFKDGISIENVGRALAAFERAIVTGPTPYDFQKDIETFETVFADDLEYLDEEPELKEQYDALKAAIAKHPMSESAKRGMKLFFGKANCTACHAGANFTDEQYHNLGVGMEVAEPDLGRYEITKVEKDKGAFKTPTLRNIAMSAPYMHDGSQKTLEEVVAWYNKGGHKNEWLSDKMKPLNLTPQEEADVVAFMKEGLTGTFPKIQTGRLPL
ncbi:c-type cytochrome [Stieleria sp. JC731]|nr:cytochrome c peroxidase [Stieleria sp. JC731]MCC9603280.1 c-type cytochrome [Stieleria sp. JC731]